MVLFAIILFLTAFVTLLSTRTNWDNSQKGFKKLTPSGRWLAFCSFLIIFFSLIQHLLNESEIKSKEKAAEIRQDRRDSVTVKTISDILGKYGYMLDTTNKRLINIQQHDNLKEEILKWDNKDERIRNVYRISKRVLERTFPYGYKIFATNPKTFFSNDSIFSNIVSSKINQKVFFDYSTNKVFLKVIPDIIFRSRDKESISYGNVCTAEFEIPIPGHYIEIGGFIGGNGYSLYFGLLDDTKDDEIFVFGYRKHSSQN